METQTEKGDKVDTERIEQSCTADIELLKKYTNGRTATYDLSIALDRAVRQRRRLVEEIERLRVLLEANRES
jgi:hypothetical protein